MFAKIQSVGFLGMDTFSVEVEADISSGLPNFSVVGLPDTGVNEARLRVRSALKNSSFAFPVSRVTINLAPADIRKEGSVFDLAILIALLKASKQLNADLTGKAFIGELSLDGHLRRVRGALPMIIKARELGIKEIFVPSDNACEGAVVEGLDVFPAKSLTDVIKHLTGEKLLQKTLPDDISEYSGIAVAFDFSDVKGQQAVKAAMEVAAAGGHNIILSGPPGSGKSMLAKRLPSILPQMTYEEALETTKIYSIAGALPEGISLIKSRPFRSPHHTVSPAGLSGGGSVPRPGEISLAHNGVLFLDELPEFSRTAMEILRQPAEDGKITISRVFGAVSYPCEVMIVCAMNPCPCGFLGHPEKQCSCRAGAAEKYLAKISGPLLDRFDIHTHVPPVDFESLSAKTKAETSAEIRERVNKARAIQNERFAGSGISCNARMTPAMLRKHCVLSPEAAKLLKAAFEKLGLSARGHDKVLKVARTIADLDNSSDIGAAHIAQAIQYRSIDRKM